MSGEVMAVAAISRRIPMRVVAGAGITIPVGGRENWSGASAIDSSAGVRAGFRAGLEVPLGRSRSAPRFSFTRSGYTKSIFSMNWLDALFISFPL
ncbi:MAG: hypothetical protein ABI877_11040 [Gemmatimonadaceae bacterium]